MKLIDLSGHVFGRWTVLHKVETQGSPTTWMCKCSCGVTRSVTSQNLRGGKSASCGCFRNENRPSLVRNRDYSGRKNPRAQKSIAASGGIWVPSNSVWYKRAAGVFYTAKKAGIPVGFGSVAQMAVYVRSIAPPVRPVFKQPFAERGQGFSKWSPSIDKVDPKLGYVPGNIQVISMLANCMKRDATREQLHMFADWIKEVR